MSISKKLEHHIYELENALLKPEVRQSADSIRELLAEDFIEFGSSGRVYNYTPGDVFDAGSVYEMEDFKARRLSRSCVLATYKAIRKGADGNTVSVTLRSSIWKHDGGTWKMVFHQGTVCEIDMDYKACLYQLLKEYKENKISTEYFCNNFERIYNIEVDYDTLNENENECFRELSLICGRFSPFEEDRKIPNAFFTEKDVDRKVGEIFQTLMQNDFGNSEQR